MSLEPQGRDPGDQMALDRDEEPSADARTDFAPVRERPPQEPHKNQDDEPEQHQQPLAQRRKGLIGRHPIAFVIGLLLVIAALPTGYLYWDYTSHFEYTDDAYIAARQFAIAPEVALHHGGSGHR